VVQLAVRELEMLRLGECSNICESWET